MTTFQISFGEHELKTVSIVAEGMLYIRTYRLERKRIVVLDSYFLVEASGRSVVLRIVSESKASLCSLVTYL